MARNAEGRRRSSWRVDLGWCGFPITGLTDHRITDQPIFGRFCLSDHQMSRSPDSEHPARPFFSRIENKSLPSIDACVTQAWPLGGPSVTQSQAQSVGRGVARHPCPYPMSTQFDPRSPKTTQGFGALLPNTKSKSQLPTASFAAASFVKDHTRTAFSLWSEFPILPFVRRAVKRKIGIG